MKKIVLAAVAFAALAAPAVANAATVRYWDPADSQFVTAEVSDSAAQALAAKADAGQYSKTVTYWDPADSAFVTAQVGDSQPLVGTHDAPRTRAEALNDFIARQADNRD